MQINSTDMVARLPAVALFMGSLAACSAGTPAAPSANELTARPFDMLPSQADLGLVREDLIATASAQFGSEILHQAVAAPTYLIVKTFAGMPPPPPAGAAPDWVAPTPAALLMKRPTGWMVATPSGWRPAKREAAAELDQVLSDPRFWSEPAYIPPCPDYGAIMLLLNIRGEAETVRKSTCTSVAEKVASAALRA